MVLSSVIGYYSVLGGLNRKKGQCKENLLFALRYELGCQSFSRFLSAAYIFTAPNLQAFRLNWNLESIPLVL